MTGAINNPTAATWEFLVRPDAKGASNLSTLYEKGESAYIGVHIGFDFTSSSTNWVYVGRYTGGGPRWLYRTPVASAIPDSSWYDIQVLWAETYPTRTGNAPVVYIDDIIQTITLLESGGTSWYDDSGYDAYIGNRSDGAQNLVGAIALFKQHSITLTNAQRHANLIADSWRVLGGYAIQTIELTRSETIALNRGENHSCLDLSDSIVMEGGVFNEGIKLTGGVIDPLIRLGGGG
jgi:hypothetical protein